MTAETMEIQPVKKTIQDFTKNYKDDQVYQVPPELLIPADWNPRTIDQESYHTLIRTIDQNRDLFIKQPFLVNAHPGREGVVVSGNQRLRAAIDLGFETVPVMFAKLDTQLQEVRAGVIFNKHQGKDDPVKVKGLFDELRDSQFDMAALGHTPIEMTDMMGFQPTDPKDNPEYKGSTPKKSPKVKIAEGAEISCPNCGHAWRYAVAAESIPPEQT